MVMGAIEGKLERDENGEWRKRRREKIGGGERKKVVVLCEQHLISMDWGLWLMINYYFF